MHIHDHREAQNYYVVRIKSLSCCVPYLVLNLEGLQIRSSQSNEKLDEKQRREILNFNLF